MDKSKLKNLIFIFLYALFTLIVLLHHEIWADEAQVWLVVRDLNLFEIIEHVRTEGHPLLWYFLVLPFSKLNLSIFSMQILSWFIMTTAAGFFFTKLLLILFVKYQFFAALRFYTGFQSFQEAIV